MDDQKWNWLLLKAENEKGDSIEMLTLKVDEYLNACGRDIGADNAAKVVAAIADPAKLLTAMDALGL